MQIGDAMPLLTLQIYRFHSTQTFRSCVMEFLGPVAEFPTARAIGQNILPYLVRGTPTTRPIMGTLSKRLTRKRQFSKSFHPWGAPLV